MINGDNDSSTTATANTSVPNGTSVKHTSEDHQEQSVQNNSTTTDQVVSTDEEATQAMVAVPQNEDEQPEEEVDEFIRITAAHQMLTEGEKHSLSLSFLIHLLIPAQAFDERKNYPSALHLYRICVDLLLEELMFTEGTDQSRIYLREKCTAIMDRIDVLKTLLDPILPATTPPPPPPITTTTTTDETSAAIPPTEDLQSLSLS